MLDKDYRRALDAAHSEIQEILRERVSLDSRLEQLKGTVEHLAALLGETPGGNWPEAVEHAISGGMSDAIRQILSESRVPMSPPEIRIALSKRNFDLSYANPMAAIHNTLKRLERQGELVTIKDSMGRVAAYTLVSSLSNLYPRSKELKRKMT